MKLTQAQRLLLADLLVSEGNSVYCKGPELRVAQALIEKQLAHVSARGRWVGAYVAMNGAEEIRARRELGNPSPPTLAALAERAGEEG